MAKTRFGTSKSTAHKSSHAVVVLGVLLAFAGAALGPSAPDPSPEDAIKVLVASSLPDPPLGLVRAYESHELGFPSACVRRQGSLTSEMMLQDIANISLTIVSTGRVSIVLNQARVRRTTGRRLTAAPFSLTGPRSRLQMVCADRYTSTPTEFRTALAGPGPVLDLKPGRSVANLDEQLEEIFTPMAVTTDSGKPTLTLFAGQRASTTFQLNVFGGNQLQRDRAPFLEEYVLDLDLDLRDIGTGKRSSRTWTTDPIALLRYLPSRSAT